MRRLITSGVAALVILSSLAVVATPAAAHVRSDTRTYVGNCDAIVLFCQAAWTDPTGGELCPSGTCRTGAVRWNATTLVDLHDGELGDGLRVKASIDDVQDPTWAKLCVAQETSETDPDGDVCNDPESEPDEWFCGSTDWWREVLVPPIDDRTDWAAVFFAGPVRQVVDNHPAPIPQRCDPLGAGATKGTVTIHVRE